MAKSGKNMTPLISAAERAKADIVECLVECEDVSKEDIIEAYELLGASFANDKDHYCLEKAYNYLHKAMLLRYTHRSNSICYTFIIIIYKHDRTSAQN